MRGSLWLAMLVLWNQRLPQNLRKFPSGGGVVAGGLLFLLVTFGWMIIRAEMTPAYAEHVTAEEAPFDLPAGATNVSSCRTNNGNVAFEFTTDAASFRQWVDNGIGSRESQRAGMKVAPIAGGV